MQNPLSSSSRSHNIALVIEDDPGARRMLMRVLHQLSFAAIGFHTAEAALAWLEMNDPPALLSVDVHLPGMNGLRFVEAIRARPRTKETPTIVVTARQHPEDEAAALLRGCAYITKPFRLNEYLQAIERLAPGDRTRTLDVTPTSAPQRVHFWARGREDVRG